MSETRPALTIERNDYRRPLLWLSIVNVFVVLVMAILGGRFFVSPSIIDVHGYIGNFVFLLFIAQAGLLVMSKPGGPLGKALIGLAGCQCCW